MWKQLIQSWVSVSHTEQVWGDIEQEGEELKNVAQIVNTNKEKHKNIWHYQ